MLVVDEEERRESCEMKCDRVSFTKDFGFRLVANSAADWRRIR